MVSAAHASCALYSNANRPWCVLGAGPGMSRGVRVDPKTLKPLDVPRARQAVGENYALDRGRARRDRARRAAPLIAVGKFGFVTCVQSGRRTMSDQRLVSLKAFLKACINEEADEERLWSLLLKIASERQQQRRALRVTWSRSRRSGEVERKISWR